MWCYPVINPAQALVGLGGHDRNTSVATTVLQSTFGFRVWGFARRGRRLSFRGQAFYPSSIRAKGVLVYSSLFQSGLQPGSLTHECFTAKLRNPTAKPIDYMDRNIYSKHSPRVIDRDAPKSHELHVLKPLYLLHTQFFRRSRQGYYHSWSR